VNPANLFASLGPIPRLPGAKCVGRYDLFDSTKPDDVTAAIELCSFCPALAACAAWVDSLPPKRRPVGVTAGRVHRPPPEPSRQRRRAKT